MAKKTQAEATMIESARSFDPVLLARIGRRLAEIIDPEQKPLLNLLHHPPPLE